MKRDFFDVPRTYYLTSYRRTQVPMFFFNLSGRFIHYLVDYEAARKKLEGTGLLPCRIFGNKAFVSFIFFNYKEVTIGGYEEVTITIEAYPESMAPPKHPLATILFKKKGDTWGNMGAYILEMPVTIPAARAAGREIWGFPKFLTRIPYRLDGDSFEFSVMNPETEEPVVDVKAEMGPGFTTTGFDLVAFNNYEDTVFQVITETDAKMKNCLCKHIEVKPGPGNHRMTQNIRDLGLDRIKPIAIMSTDNCRSKLNAGRPLSICKSPILPYRHEDEIAFEKELAKRPK